ncbi:MAG: hypothetical protein KDE53_13395 [Caldilineaceae bacterium]|nr:hypothetical protein [Caldilineaceae bacterium]
MRTETVTLGDREYTLTELPLRKARAYRERLREPFGNLVDLFERTPNTEIDNARQVAQLMRTLSDTLLNSVDMVVELLLDYDERLDREYIEENAYGSQVVDAFIAVLGLTFPFFGNSRVNKAMAAIGSGGAQTTTN